MFLCLVILGIACMCDAYSGRIPRQLTGFGMLISQAWVIYHSSVSEALIALIGGMGVMIILYPVFMIGALGGGDIKLLMILPAYMSFVDSLFSVFLAFMAGAVIGSVVLIRNGSFITRISNLVFYVRQIGQGKMPGVYDIPPSQKGEGIKDHQIHFSLPILIGVVIKTCIPV